MDGYLHQALLNDSGAFHAYRNVHCLELWRLDGVSKPVFRHGDLPEQDFADWLRQRGNYSWPEVCRGKTQTGHLRVLACKLDEGLRDWAHTGVPGTGALSLPMSRTQYENVLDQMALPDDLLTISSRQTAAWVRSSRGFVMKANSSRSLHFALASSLPSTSTLTNVLLFGLGEPQLMELCECLRHENTQLPLHALMPVLLIELRAEATWGHVSHSHTAIFHTEGQTGVFTEAARGHMVRESGFRLSPSGAKVFPGVRKSVDYEQVTVQLTSTITELAHSLFTCDVHVRMLNELPRLIDNQNLNDNFHNKIDYLKCYYRGLESRANYVMRRAQAQVQTVYSMVAQRDSAASAALAEASRQDNILMRKIAEDSKRVAIATSRDSAAMKIIAGVTILFLPATFVATLFSTSFFDFQQPGKVVSWWIWLYWVITIGLTLIIHAAWYFISRNKEREIEHKFGEKREREALEPILHQPK